MTVCVGVSCRDGVVLAADTQVTYLGSHKDYAPKIDHIGNRYFCAGLAGSGSFDVLNEIFLRLRDETKVYAPSSYGEIRNKIKSVLSSIVKARKRETKNQYLLAAIAIPPRPVTLVHFYRDIPSEPDLSVIGCGNTELSKYLQSWISRTPETIAEGLHWATYIIYKAKQFVDGCDGDTDAICVTSDGKVDYIQRTQMKYYEGYFSSLEEEVFDLFGRMAIGRMNKTEMGLYLGALQERLKRLHTKNNT